MKVKKAIITGVTGQDGSYLSEYLLKKNYIVYGIKRKSSSFNTDRINHLYSNKKFKKKFSVVYGDLTDSSSIRNIINKIKPDEIYNLAAQSHVGVSFEQPEYTANVDGLGTLRILEAVRLLNLEKHTKIYQASTSELYGLVQETPQSETTPFYPRSPYAVAKMYAYWITVNYREAFGIFACNGILFNHESPRRGPTFVTKKIVQGLVRIKKQIQKKITLGNLYAVRDWGHAKDYVNSMWKILQYKKPEDWVIATNKENTVKNFINITAKKLTLKIEWKGSGLKEKAYDTTTGQVIVDLDPKFFRPSEVDFLKGDYSKAKKFLKWKPSISTDELIDDMIKGELSKKI